MVLEFVTSSLQFAFLLVESVCLLLEFAERCAFSGRWCESSQEVDDARYQRLHELFGFCSLVGDWLMCLLMQVFSDIVDVQVVGTRLR